MYRQGGKWILKTRLGDARLLFPFFEMSGGGKGVGWFMRITETAMCNTPSPDQESGSGA